MATWQGVRAEGVLTPGVNDWRRGGVPALLGTLRAAGGTHLWDVRDRSHIFGTAPWAGKHLQPAWEAAGVVYVRHREWAYQS